VRLMKRRPVRFTSRRRFCVSVSVSAIATRPPRRLQEVAWRQFAFSVTSLQA
jgi:hypothetical protein